jgi:hypothetical protein
MSNGSTLRLAASLALPLALVAPDAFAYLDPSTGSMILSAIVGMFATAALALKTYWYKLKGLFRREPPREDPGAGPAGPGRDSKPASD